MYEELTTVFKIEQEIMETQEEFIYTSIYPFCEQVVNHRLSKKELEKILRKGMKYDELLEQIKQAREEIEHLSEYGKETYYRAIDDVLEILDKLIESEK